MTHVIWHELSWSMAIWVSKDQSRSAEWIFKFYTFFIIDFLSKSPKKSLKICTGPCMTISQMCIIIWQLLRKWDTLLCTQYLGQTSKILGCQSYGMIHRAGVWDSWPHLYLCILVATYWTCQPLGRNCDLQPTGSLNRCAGMVTQVVLGLSEALLTDLGTVHRMMCIDFWFGRYPPPCLARTCPSLLLASLTSSLDVQSEGWTSLFPLVILV